MAQGTPVVTSSGTATEEVVGDAGITCDPTDAAALAAALATLVGDEAEAKRLGSAGQVRAATYTWAAAAAGYADAYLEALR
jgi:glycosyltransferase involved in cell wall biosynthesis